MEVNELVNEICGAMPDGWTLRIELELNGGTVELDDDFGDEVYLCDDDLTFEERITQRVDLARLRAGLRPQFDPDFQDPDARPVQL